MKLKDLTMPGAERYSDLALLILRVTTGLFLLYQSHDNLLSAARMAEFAGFMGQFGFWRPDILAPFAIFRQVVAGISFILGLFVRPLGLITAIQFAVAVWMVHWTEPIPGIWPAAVLVALGLYFGTRGGGPYALDTLIGGGGGGSGRRR